MKEEDAELSDEMVAQLCKFMRLIDLFDKNETIIEDNLELVDTVKELRVQVNRIMDLLSDEQKDYVLEVHKIQTEYIAEELKKEEKNAKKKQK